MADPIIRRTIADSAGLRAGPEGDGVELLAIYTNQAGEDVFTLEREGVRLLPGGRFIAYRDIEDLRFYPGVKTEPAARKLGLTLSGGEQLDLPIDGTVGHHVDVFTIYAFMRRRIHQKQREAAAI